MLDFKLSKVAQILEGQELHIQDLSVSDIPFLKYARVISCDVERSFFQYRAMVRDNQQIFVIDNLEKTLIVHCNLIIFNRKRA